jgi:tetratricopeptide (TPR) repeat protein
VYAANDSRFVQGYRDISRQLRLPGHEDAQVDTCKLVSDWLDGDDHDAQWLLILDNADDADLFLPRARAVASAAELDTNTRSLMDYLPRRLHATRSMMVTTRNRDIGENLGEGKACIEVGPFSVDEAQALLRSKARRPIDGSDDGATQTLVEVLGCIPLAISQAAAYMNRNSMDVRKYLTALKKDQQNLIDHLSAELHDHRRERGYPNSVFRTWRLSFEQIRRQEHRATEGLSLMAMLDGQQIPQDLIQKQDEREVEFYMALGTLEGYSLIIRVEQDAWAMHPLVQLSVRDWLAEVAEDGHVAEQAVQLLAERFPNGEYENKKACESLLPHARAVLQCNLSSESGLKNKASLLHNLGWFEWREGRYAWAEEIVRAEFEILQGVVKENDILMGDSLSLLGTVLNSQGKYEQAEEMHRQALALRETVLGKEHPSTLTSMSNLAGVLNNQGKYEQAEEMYQQVLALRETVLGKEHPSTLTSMNNLALVLSNQGKYEQAEEMHRPALALRETVLGKEHPDTLASMNNLAGVLSDQGKYEQAEEMHRQALVLRETVLGKEHPSTLASMNNLAEVLSSQGEYEQAEEMYRQALALCETVLGKEHPSTLTSMANWASTCWNQERWDEAENLERQVMEIRSRVLGHRHPDTLMIMANLAHTLKSQGRDQEAIALMRQAESLQKEILGIDHPDTMRSSKAVEYWLAMDVNERA